MKNLLSNELTVKEVCEQIKRSSTYPQIAKQLAEQLLLCDEEREELQAALEKAEATLKQMPGNCDNEGRGCNNSDLAEEYFAAKG